MEHNLHHPTSSLPWGYPSATPAAQNTWLSPPQTRSMKRALSESDCEELYSEESSKEQTSPSENNSCQLMSRKKRRGVIEKKRRDRINSSLSELKRLVPSAYEKQGSAKLEKAEILQLTVEHLKNLHAKGLDSVAYDPQRFAMDYHIIGFRECAAEVARYLVTIEGMDIQDPLRLRLMSHLQYFVQQRELSAKACSSPNWSSTAYQTTQCTPPTYHHAHHQTVYPPPSQTASTNSYIPNLPPPIQPYPSLSTPTTAMHHQHHHASSVSLSQHSRLSSTAISQNSISAVTDSSTVHQTHLQHTPQQQQQQQRQQQQQQGQPQTNQQQQQQIGSQQSHQGLSPQNQTPQPQQQHHYSSNTGDHEHHQSEATYIELTSSNAHRNSTSAATLAGYHGATTTHYPSVPGAEPYTTAENVNYGGNNGAKPYRPWGAEMAY